jgi:hypothetical protein
MMIFKICTMAQIKRQTYILVTKLLELCGTNEDGRLYHKKNQ